MSRLLIAWSGLPVAAAIALLVALPPAAAQPVAAQVSTGPVYVALGDSYTSGPLIPQATGPLGCGRSTHDYPSLVAAALHASSFTDMSCGGAATANMTGSESVPFGTNPPQLSALSSNTTLVTLGIGGNDINFLNIVINCASLSFIDPFGAPCKAAYTSDGTNQLAQAVKQTAPKIAKVLQEIHQRAPQARVLVVGYPDLLPATGHGCWPVVPFAAGDVPFLNGVEADLNQMLAREAAANGATFVNTYSDSVGHDACQGSPAAWVDAFTPTLTAVPLHPTAAGEQAMAREVVAAAG